MKQRNNWSMKIWLLGTQLWQGWLGWKNSSTPCHEIDRPSPLFRPKLKKWFYRLSLLCVTAVWCVIMGGGVAAQITPQITPQSLLNQGRSLYEAGQLTEALEPIQAAIAQYRAQQNDLGESVALSNLALVQEQRGALPEAVGAIATSIDRLTTLAADDPSDSHQSALAQSLNVQARIQLAQGQAEAALQTLEQAIAHFEELGHQQGVIRSKIRQAEALQTLGFHQAAIALLDPLYGQFNGTLIYEEAAAEAVATTATAETCPTLPIRPNTALEVSTIRHLAQAYYQIGQLDRAKTLMCESEQLAGQPSDRVAAQLGLANIDRLQAAIARSQGDSNAAAANAEAALKMYDAIAQASFSSATEQFVQVQAQLNRLSLLLDLDRIPEAITAWPTIQQQLSTLPSNRSGLYARMNLAKALMRLQTLAGADVPHSPQVATMVIEQELQQVMQYADAIGDRRAASFALGYLGELYETEYGRTKEVNQWQQAQQFTQEALLIATQIDADDIAYQWHWQMGRLLTAQAERDGGLDPASAGDKKWDGAIAAYQSAIHTLEGLRRDLVTVNREVQFSFQENVEPIHRQLVDLLLKKDDAFQLNHGGTSNASTIKQAQETIESLQLVELTNFLREACVNVGTVDDIEQVLTQSEAAVIYPIILGDRLEVIVSLPDSAANQTDKQASDGAAADDMESASTLRRVSVPITQADLEDLMGRFYDGVYNFISIGYRPLAEQAYDILIRPIEAELAASSTDTLVFVLDGVLRNVPMGALHDGEQFLVEKYSIALTPGIQLLPNLLASDSIQNEPLSVVAMGLSEGVQGFLPLPNVNNEIEQIKGVIPDTQALLNEDFTAEGFAELLSTTPAPIVHLATHGQFSSQQENTFVLTWNEKINIGNLSQALQTGADRRQAPIEMLVLSACETASGDRRAALGLAGVAIRAGARSTVASLWQVDDAAAAEMMGEFYRQIASRKVSKAEALRQAQLKILTNPQYRQHPYYWAPFVLVGNWR